MPRIARVLVLVLFAAPAAANAPAQPHAAPPERAIKALSPREVADLRAGRGMGLALAAERNAYPGPMHVLEHADALALDTAQRARAGEVMAAMRIAAIAVGERLIAAEARLDALFAGGTAAEASVGAATAAIAVEQAALRALHLNAHIAMRAAMTASQIERYGVLRGHAEAQGHQPKH